MKTVTWNEEVEDVLETTLVPEDAAVISPGRDYVYLEDDEYYYVEDTTKNLLTIASKNVTKDDTKEE